MSKIRRVKYGAGLRWKPEIPEKEIENFGTKGGEICNRGGCEEEIEERDFEDGSCSCHISPPCSFCMAPPFYCPSCGWEGDIDGDTFTESRLIAHDTGENDE